MITPVLFFKDKTVIYSFTQNAFIAHKFLNNFNFVTASGSSQFLIDLEYSITNSQLYNERFDTIYYKIMEICYECGDPSLIQKWTYFGKKYQLYYDGTLVQRKRRRAEIIYKRKYDELIQRAEYFERKASDLRQKAMQMTIPTSPFSSQINSSVGLPLIQAPDLEFHYFDIDNEKISPDLCADTDSAPIIYKQFSNSQDQDDIIQFFSSTQNDKTLTDTSSECGYSDNKDIEIPNAQNIYDSSASNAESETGDIDHKCLLLIEHEKEDMKGAKDISSKNNVPSNPNNKNQEPEPNEKYEIEDKNRHETDNSSDFEIHFGSLSDESQPISQEPNADKIKEKSIIDMTLSQILSQK